MKVRVNYLILGIFVIFLGSGIIYGFYWFSKDIEASNFVLYRVYFTESISGLSENSMVKYNGVKVGSIKSIEISKVNYRQTVLTLQIAEDTPITEETYATKISQGITGLAYVGLKTLIPFGKKITTPPNELYPVIKTSPSLFVEIDRAVNDITIHLKSLSSRVENILDDDNQKAFKKSLTNIAKITENLSTKSEAMDQSFDRVDEFLDEFTKISKRLPSFITKMERTLDTFEKTANSIGKSTKHFNETMQDTSRLINDLNQQIVPIVNKSLEQLDSTLSGIDVISRDVQENPSILVRGRYPADLGPGEYK